MCELFKNWHLIERVADAGKDISDVLGIPLKNRTKSTKTGRTRLVPLVDADAVIQRLRPPDDASSTAYDDWRTTVACPLMNNKQTSRWITAKRMYPSPWDELFERLCEESHFIKKVKKEGERFIVRKSDQLDDLCQIVIPTVYLGVVRNAVDWIERQGDSWWGYCWGIAKGEISRSANELRGLPRTAKAALANTQPRLEYGSDDWLSQAPDHRLDIEKDNEDAKQAVDKLLSTLSKQKASIVRRHTDGSSYKQIAAEHQISVERVRRLYNEAVSEMREAAEEE